MGQFDRVGPETISAKSISLKKHLENTREKKK